MRSPLTAVLILALWGAFGTITTLQYYLLTPEGAPQLTLAASLIGGLLPWLVYAAATPLIFALSRRWPLELAPRGRHVALHLAVMAALAAAHQLAWVTCLLLANDYFSLEALTHKWPSTGLRLLNTELLAYWGVLGVAHALQYQRRLREGALLQAQLQTQLAEAQLEALKMQLHPHFLFNTLNAITVLVKKQETATATRMIGGLAELLRMALQNRGAQVVPLCDELAFVDRFLEIEQVRFGPRLRVERRVAPETLAALVPSLVLQPLVENAIKHGLEPKAEGGCLALEALRDGDRLCIVVSDDGAGLRSGASPGQGVGLGNIRERLERLYGAGEARLEIHEGSPGLRVVLELPWRDA